MPNAKRILLAGCADSDVKQCCDICSDLDCQIEAVTSGADALGRLQRFQPHLTILDTTLENPDAFDLCRRIKMDHTSLVLIATELNELNDIDRAVESGTDDLLCKPVNKNELRKRVELTLRLHDALH